MKASRLIISSSRHLRPATGTTRLRNRPLHTSSPNAALPLPYSLGQGPTPAPPTAPTAESDERIARKKKQAAIIAQVRNEKFEASTKPTTVLKKRFWTDVHVRESPGLAFFLLPEIYISPG
jgi:hypothetical protein